VQVPLQRIIGNSSSEALLESVIVLLVDNVNMFSPVCVSKIEKAEDVGIGAVEVCFVKILVNSPNW